MKKLILSFLIILLAQPMSFAIGTKKTMEKIMNSWNGEHIDSVIAKWGYPSREKTIAGHKLYVWDNGSAITENTWGTALLEQQACTRTFEVNDNNVIINWQWTGVNCPALYCTSKKWVNPKNNPWKKSAQQEL